MASNKKTLKPVVRDSLIPAATVPVEVAPVVTPVVENLPVEAPRAIVDEKDLAKPATVAVPKYRVKSNCKASFCGQLVKLHKDDVIDSSGYGGVEGIKRFIDSGADLEEVK